MVLSASGRLPVSGEDAESGGSLCVELRSADMDNNLGTELNSTEKHVIVVKVFKPFIRLLQVCGLHLEDEKGTGTLPDQRVSNQAARWRVMIILKLVHSLLLYLLLFLCTIRFLPLLIRRGFDLAQVSLPLFMWLLYLLGIFYHTTFILDRKVIMETGRRFTAYFTSHGYGSEWKKVRRAVNISSVIIVAYCLLQAVYSDVLYADVKHQRWILTPFETIQYPLGTFLEILLVLVSSILMIPTQIYASLFILVSILLTKEFSRLTAAMETWSDDVQKNGSRDIRWEMTLERLRQHHETLTALVRRASRILCHMASCSLLTSLVMACIMVYGFANSIFSDIECVLIMVKAFPTLVTTMVLTVISSRLSNKAHEPRDILLRTKVDNLSDKTVQIINLFLGRLNGASIGYSVYGLFTIDMSTILTLTSTLIAYVIVVLQFKVGKADCSRPEVTPVDSPENWTVTTPSF